MHYFDPPAPEEPASAAMSPLIEAPLEADLQVMEELWSDGQTESGQQVNRKSHFPFFFVKSYKLTISVTLKD